MNSHLTNEQLLDLLAGAPQPALTAHLRDCTPCRSEFDALRESLTSFRVAATGMAEAYAPMHMPTRLLEGSSAHPGFFHRRFLSPRTAWATGLVTAIALCTASLSVLHRTPQPQTQAVSRIDMQSSAPADPASSDTDAALLDGIDRDLSTSVPPSLQPLDVTSASETTSTSSHN